MEPYPIAIIGVGPAGRAYLRDLLRDWRLRVVGLVNRNPDRREAVSRETGVPGFATLADLLAGVSVKPKLVIIASANPTHKDFAIECLERGLHCFCEKPMAMTLADCRTMLDVARRHPECTLQIGFEYRYGSMTARVKELQDHGFFGELTAIDITDSRGHWWPDRPDTPLDEVWRLNPAIGGGPILHCGIHQLDLMRYYAGEPETVQAFVQPNSLTFYPAGIPDHLRLQVRFRSGACGSFTLYHNIAGTWYRPIPPHHPNYHAVPGHGMDMVLTGRKGSAICQIYREELHLNRFDHDNRETCYLRTETFGHQHPNVSHHNTPQMIVESALRCRDSLPPLQSAEDSYATTVFGQVCENAVQAAIADGWTSRPVPVRAD